MSRSAAPDLLFTARLRGERLGPRHHGVLAPILADPRVGATLGGVRTSEEVAALLERSAESWAGDGFGYWMFFERATGRPIGRGGLARTDLDGQEEVEIGWTVAPARWGEGFATEMGGAACEIAFKRLRLPHVVAFTLPHNTASRRVMEKLGFAYEKTAPFRHHGDHVLYRRQAGGEAHHR